MNKEWKLIKDFSNYEVSNFGDIRNVKTKKELKKQIGLGKYYAVQLKNNFDKRCSVYVHRMVAENFLKKDKNKLCVNHKNGNKLDNNILNLEWCTNGENIKHAYEMKLNEGNKKYDKDMIEYIKKNPNNLSQKELSIKTKISYKHINSILNLSKRKNVIGKINKILLSNSTKPKEIIINGIKFSSIREISRKLNINRKLVSKKLKEDWGEFCRWIISLPKFSYLTGIYEEI